MSKSLFSINFDSKGNISPRKIMDAASPCPPIIVETKKFLCDLGFPGMTRGFYTYYPIIRNKYVSTLNSEPVCIFPIF